MLWPWFYAVQKKEKRKQEQAGRGLIIISNKGRRRLLLKGAHSHRKDKFSSLIQHRKRKRL